MSCAVLRDLAVRLRCLLKLESSAEARNTMIHLSAVEDTSSQIVAFSRVMSRFGLSDQRADRPHEEV